MKALVSGTFDPVTNGHLDLIRRASALFDDVTVGIFKNSSKNCLFSENERLELLADAIKDIPNAHAELCSGLVAKYCVDNSINVIIKGIRSFKDYDYELEMAKVNRMYCAELETVFLPADPQYDCLSSNMVRIFHANGEDVSAYVPQNVSKAISSK